MRCKLIYGGYTCNFIGKRENIIFIGQPGTGKTHLSVALALKALGYGYAVLFTAVWEMITALEGGRADLSYRKKVRSFLKPDLLILDELGYHEFRAILSDPPERSPCLPPACRQAGGRRAFGHLAGVAKRLLQGEVVQINVTSYS